MAQLFILLVPTISRRFKMKVEVPAWEWYGWKTEELEFPDGWTVNEQRMHGHDAPALTRKRIAEKLEHPIGTPTLRELCRGRRKTAIIFDDMTRPTKTWQVLPSILDELYKGGLTDEQIVFVMASGAHSGRMVSDFRKKLGDEVPERFRRRGHAPLRLRLRGRRQDAATGRLRHRHDHGQPQDKRRHGSREGWTEP
jgi:nickel-dependent lactate racemase